MKISEANLRLLALLMIGLLAGPEIGIAMEMTVLLELLGAALFFMAFSVGARMLAVDLALAIRNFVFPAVLCGLGWPVIFINAALCIVFTGVGVVMVGAYVLELFARN